MLSKMTEYLSVTFLAHKGESVAFFRLLWVVYGSFRVIPDCTSLYQYVFAFFTACPVPFLKKVTSQNALISKFSKNELSARFYCKFYYRLLLQFY